MNLASSDTETLNFYEPKVTPTSSIYKPSKYGWRGAIRNFSWMWHTAVMGTGAIAGLASNFPFAHDSSGLKYFTLIFTVLNFALYVLVTGMTIARYSMFSEQFAITMRNPRSALPIAAFPMGATTVINNTLAAHLRWNFGGPAIVYTLWALWLINNAISIVIAMGMLYAMIAVQTHTLLKMTPTWLFPVLTLVVGSGTGGLLADALPTSYALPTVGISLTMLLIGMSMTFMIVTIYLARLIIHGAPEPELILSSLIVLGPLGQGGFSFLVNGRVAAKSQLGLNGALPLEGETIYTLCFVSAWLLWSMGIAWIGLSMATLWAGYKSAGDTLPSFSVAYWGTIFPNGQWALCSLEIGKSLHSPFFNYIGAIWSVVTLALWTGTSAMSIWGMRDGSVFR